MSLLDAKGHRSSADLLAEISHRVSAPALPPLSFKMAYLPDKKLYRRKGRQRAKDLASQKQKSAMLKDFRALSQELRA